MKTGRRFPREVALEIAAKVRAAIAPFCDRIEYAGSIRRRLPDCGDVDILVIPASDDPRDGVRAVSDAFASLCVGGELESSGGSLDIGMVGEVPVNVFYTDADRWGAALLYTTGSKTYNIASRAWAKSQGLRLTQDGVVIVSTGKRIPNSGHSEAAVLSAVRLPWLPPERRTGSAFGIERSRGPGPDWWDSSVMGHEWNERAPVKR